MAGVVRAACLAMATCSLLAACGQKGPLFLPDRPQDVVTRPASTSTPASTPATAPTDRAPDTPDPASDGSSARKTPKP